jgi:hypothetical protein
MLSETSFDEKISRRFEEAAEARNQGDGEMKLKRCSQ